MALSSNIAIEGATAQRHCAPSVFLLNILVHLERLPLSITQSVKQSSVVSCDIKHAHGKLVRDQKVLPGNLESTSRSQKKAPPPWSLVGRSSTTSLGRVDGVFLQSVHGVFLSNTWWHFLITSLCFLRWGKDYIQDQSDDLFNTQSRHDPL